MSIEEGAVRVEHLTWTHDVEVRDCSLGKGVFALREIEMGEIIGIVRGQIVDDENESPDYCIEMDEIYSLNPLPPFRFLNHCCSPNAEFIGDEPDQADRFPEVYVVAVKAIQDNEEICVDYAWPVEDAIRCECGSPECRGWIVANEEVHKVVPGD